jgi:predicted glycosyltransferase
MYVKVWIDHANSPHPLLFAPVVRALERRGHEVAHTARDNAQTVELARERWPDVVVIGAESPPGRTAKAWQIARRAWDLRTWARHERPAVALSHGSYAQIVAARSLRIPAVTAADYEHQPASQLAFRLARRVLLPEALRGSHVEHQGARDGKVRWYEGLKEELYLGDFRPDPNVLRRLGVRRDPGVAIVVARTPPSRALYHQLDNPLFGEVLTTLARRTDVRCVVLTRHPEQRTAIEALHAPNVVVPSTAVDSRSLMLAADVVIGAGGTMTREAALLGVPTFSLFAGRPAAADAWLQERGLLQRLQTLADMPPCAPRAQHTDDLAALRERGAKLVDVFVDAALEACGSSS